MIYIFLGSITAQHYDDTYRTTINNLIILIHNLHYHFIFFLVCKCLLV